MIFSISNEQKLYPLTYVCIIIVSNLFEALSTNQSCFISFHSPVKYSVCGLYIYRRYPLDLTVLELGCELCLTPQVFPSF